MLGRWHQKAWTYAEARRLVVEPATEAIEPLLENLEPEVPTRFGYTLRLWNGRARQDERCQLSVAAGISDPQPGVLTNRVILNLTHRAEYAPDLHTPESVLHILACITRIWCPDSATVMSQEYSRTQRKGEPPIPGKPKVGWMTYLRAERLAEVPARIPCKTVELAGLGTIFVVTDEHQFSAHNPDDVARALALTEFLERHKALRIIPLNVPV